MKHSKNIKAIELVQSFLIELEKTIESLIQGNETSPTNTRRFFPFC